MYVNPTQYLVPILSIVIGIVPVLYFGREGMLFILAALAYFIAIAAKIIVEGVFAGFFQQHSLPTYIAYGVLTAVFEVGFAYAFVRLYKGSYSSRKGWAYGSYLAFFENTIFVGGLSLLTLVVVNFITIHTSSSNPYGTNVLSLSIPAAFERITSYIAHAVWGFLAFTAALKKKPLYVLAAVPLAFVDSAAVWWDFTHAISYPLLIALLFTYTVAVSAIALYLSGLLKDARAGLSRKHAENE